MLPKKINESVEGGALIALSVSKINNGKGFKDIFSSQPEHRNNNKKFEHVGVCLETIKSKQVQVKRALRKILSTEVLKD